MFATAEENPFFLIKWRAGDFSENYICLYLFVEKRDIQTVFHSKVHDLVFNKQLEKNSSTHLFKEEENVCFLHNPSIMTESKYEIWKINLSSLSFYFILLGLCTMNWLFLSRFILKLIFFCKKRKIFLKKSGNHRSLLLSDHNILGLKRFVFSYLFIQQSLRVLCPVFLPFLLPILVLILMPHCFLPKIISYLRKKQNFWKEKNQKQLMNKKNLLDCCLDRLAWWYVV